MFVKIKIFETCRYSFGIDVNGMRHLMDRIKNKMEKSIILLYNINKEEGKVVFLCGVTKTLLKQYDASLVAKRIADEIGGSGGGKRELAQAGSKNIKDVKKAIDVLYALTGGKHE